MVYTNDTKPTSSFSNGTKPSSSFANETKPLNYTTAGSGVPIGLLLTLTYVGGEETSIYSFATKPS